MIDFKIKKWCKIKIADHDQHKAYKTMLGKYKALSVDKKAEFEQDLDVIINQYE